MSEAELQAILMVGYGYGIERDVFGDVHWVKGNPLPRPNPLNYEPDFDPCRPTDEDEL